MPLTSNLASKSLVRATTSSLQGARSTPGNPTSVIDTLLPRRPHRLRAAAACTRGRSTKLRSQRRGSLPVDDRHTVDSGAAGAGEAASAGQGRRRQRQHGQAGPPAGAGRPRARHAGWRCRPGGAGGLGQWRAGGGCRRRLRSFGAGLLPLLLWLAFLRLLRVCPCCLHGGDRATRVQGARTLWLERCKLSLSLSLSLSPTWLEASSFFFLHLSGQYQSDKIPSHQPGWLE